MKKKPALALGGFVLLLVAIPYYVLTSPILSFKKGVSFAHSSESNLERHVEFLCNTPHFRNFRNLESLNMAADYIQKELASTADSVWFQAYEVSGNTYKNVIASFGPRDGERIVIGAHYDVCNEQAGADDNASGVAGLLEIARILSQHKTKINKRIDLVAYTLEEPPFFRTFEMGSAHHARECKRNDVEIELMVCLEMIGYFSDEEHSQSYPIDALGAFYPDQGNYIAIVGELGKGKWARRFKRAMKSAEDLPVESIAAPKSMPGIDFSDHLNYWTNGYDAIMITNTSFYRNRNYHEPTDLPETLDYSRMNKVVNGTAFAILGLASD